MPNLSLKPTVGLSPGETIQFAVGRWSEDIGDGVALSEDGFDAIESHLQAVWKDWTPQGRYGAMEMPQPVVVALADRLRIHADQLNTEAELFAQLADWLEAHSDGQQPISVLGY